MDGIDQPFSMDDDYGFYEDLDSDDDTVPLAHVSSEGSGLSVPVCGSRIEDRDRDSLLACPPILTPFVADAIAEDGLPWSMQDTQWERLFASTRDGTSFGTFMRRVRGRGQTVVVAKTSDGKVVGGYATDVWSGRKLQGDSQDEASHAFVFVVEPPAAAEAKRAAAPTHVGHTFIPGLEELGKSPSSAFDFDFHQLSVSSHKKRDAKPHVEIFKPSQKPRDNAGWKQACQLGNKLISMSDASGDLTLVFENSFSRGVVARTGEDREEFTIVEFEVYGLSED